MDENDEQDPPGFGHGLIGRMTTFGSDRPDQAEHDQEDEQDDPQEVGGT